MAFDNLDDLRVLLATADTGSLTAAGRRCGHYAVLPSARFTPHRVKVMVDALAAWSGARMGSAPGPA
jgi:hypothetical protein